ncbi:MAG: DNA alkylation repair protein [Planctomycetes bacterium]|nr:DNA alkylation repair protein [Planctomycetota bacterium]
MLKKIVAELKAHANPKNVAGMARYGINPHNTLGVSIPFLRGLAKKIGKNHALALELWDSGIHEARILAGMIDGPSLVTSAQMDRWAGEFDSWDVCDQVCSNLFDKTPFAYEKAVKWSKSKKEFVKRAGYVMMAALSVHDKRANDEKFIGFFPLITAGALDERNFVKKAVNWAVRQIGKRNRNLNKKAIALAKKIQKLDSKSARWIAADALRELERRMKNEE